MIEENFDLEMNYWTNENGQRLRWREWRHDNPRAIVFFSHSYGLHAGLIHNIAHSMVEAGYSVFAHDHLFHGESEPANPCHINRCQWECFNSPVRDIAERIRWLKRDIPNVPVFIWGHGVGGLLAIRVSIEYSDLVDGMLLESPMLNLNDGISGLWGKRAASSFLSYLVPNLKFNLVEPYSLSSDRRSVDALLADTLCYLDKGISANLMTRLDVQFTKVDQMLPLISKPFCTFVGEDDTLISLPSCSRLDTISSSNDKNIISYPGTRHLLHLEHAETRARFIHDMLDWMNNRSSEPQPKATKKKSRRATRHPNS